MKRFSVVFIVQADTIEEADKQAAAFLKTPAFFNHLTLTGDYKYRPMFEVIDDDAIRHNGRRIESAPHLPMVACKTCGKKLIDDGWVKFCSEECDDGSR